MPILSGCAKIGVRTVKVDSFCTGRYEPLYLTKKDFEVINDIRYYKKSRKTLDKIIDHTTIHEKEFEACDKEKEGENEEIHAKKSK